MVREIFKLGGPVKGLVPPLVEERLHRKVLPQGSEAVK